MGQMNTAGIKRDVKNAKVSEKSFNGKSINNNELRTWIIALILALALLFLLSLTSCANTQKSNETSTPDRSGSSIINLAGDSFKLVKSPRTPTFAFSSNNKKLSIALSRDGRITDVDLNNGLDDNTDNNDKKISTGKDGGFVITDKYDNDTYYYLTGSVEDNKFSTLMRRVVLLSKYEGTENSVHITGKIKSDASDTLGVYKINLSYRLPVNLEGWEVKQGTNYVEFSKENMVIGIRDLTGSGTFHYSEASGAYVDYELIFLPQRKTNDFEFEIYAG